MCRGHDFADQHTERVAGHPGPGRHQDEDQDRADPPFDEEVGGEFAIAAMGLQQPTIDAEQDPDPRGHEDEDHPQAAREVELACDPSLEHQHDHELHRNGSKADPMHPSHPGPHQGCLTGRLEPRDPAHHADQDSRARHGQDKEEPEQLGQFAVGLRRQQTGHRHHHQGSGRVHGHAGDRHRSGLAKAGLQGVAGVDAARRRFIGGQGDHGPTGNGDPHGRPEGQRLRQRVDDRVDLVEEQAESAVSCVVHGHSSVVRGAVPCRPACCTAPRLVPRVRHPRHALGSAGASRKYRGIPAGGARSRRT